MAKKITHHIKFTFPAGEARSGPPLGPVIAMFQLNIAQVCKDLNEQSANFVNGVPLGAKIYKKEGEKAYKLKVISPSLKFYIEMALLSTIKQEFWEKLDKQDHVDESLTPYILSVEALYDSFKLFAGHKNLFFNEQSCKIFFSHLSSFQSPFVKAVEFLNF